MITDDAAGKGPQTVSLANEEAVKLILVSTVFGLWDIVNHLTRLRPSRSERYRVTRKVRWAQVSRLAVHSTPQCPCLAAIESIEDGIAEMATVVQ